MVDATDARNIAKDVVKRYGTAVDFEVVEKGDLSTMNIDKIVWEKMNYMPPAFFDFKKIYLVSPNENWPDWGQVNKGKGGTEGISTAFCFYLFVKELGHKTYIPGFPLNKAMEKKVLRDVQPGFELYQPFIDGMLVDVMSMKSPFVKTRFRQYPNIITGPVKARWLPKIAKLYSNGADIVVWEEVIARISVAAAESEISGKDPQQPSSSGSTGVLSKDLKKTERGKEQMDLVFTMYQVAQEAVEAAVKRDMDTFFGNYRLLAELLKEILGTNAEKIMPPIPLDIETEVSSLSGYGFIPTRFEAEKILYAMNQTRKAEKED